jgi:hypothetical protein
LYFAQRWSKPPSAKTSDESTRILRKPVKKVVYILCSKTSMTGHRSFAVKMGFIKEDKIVKEAHAPSTPPPFSSKRYIIAPKARQMSLK